MGRSCGTFKHAVAKNPSVNTAPTINKIWLKNIAVSKGGMSQGERLVTGEKSRSGANHAGEIARVFQHFARTVLNHVQAPGTQDLSTVAWKSPALGASKTRRPIG